MNDDAIFDGTAEWPERYLCDTENDPSASNYGAQQAYLSAMNDIENPFTDNPANMLQVFN